VVAFDGHKLERDQNIKKYRYEIVKHDVSWNQNVQDRKLFDSIVNNFYTKVTSTPATQ